MSHRRGAHLRPGEHPPGRLQTVIPYGFYPSRSGATISSGARRNSTTPLRQVQLRRGSRTANRCTTCARPRTGRTPTSRGRTTRRIAEPLRRQRPCAFRPVPSHRRRARPCRVVEVTSAQLLADLRKQLENAVAQSATDPFGFGFPWNTFDTTIPRRRPGRDGGRVRRAHGHENLRRLRLAVARQHPRSKRLGHVAHRR